MRGVVIGDVVGVWPLLLVRVAGGEFCAARALVVRTITASIAKELLARWTGPEIDENGGR